MSWEFAKDEEPTRIPARLAVVDVRDVGITGLSGMPGGDPARGTRCFAE